MDLFWRSFLYEIWEDQVPLLIWVSTSRYRYRPGTDAKGAHGGDDLLKGWLAVTGPERWARCGGLDKSA
jgi:hypothetical protein